LDELPTHENYSSFELNRLEVHHAREKNSQKSAQSQTGREGPSTQAGEFVREEIEHVRGGKHGARSTKQAIAIGLSKARLEGVKLPPPARGKTSPMTRKKAAADLKAARKKKVTTKKRSRASLKALRREGRRAASKKSLSREAKKAR
jgi:uncharacterized protein DUF6496